MLYPRILTCNFACNYDINSGISGLLCVYLAKYLSSNVYLGILWRLFSFGIRFSLPDN